MACVKKVEKIEKIDGGEVKIHKLLSHRDIVFNEQGNEIECFKKVENLFAIVTPEFCKQLHMLTDNCNYDNYMSMIKDARIFCNRVYDAIAAYGLEIQGYTDVAFSAVKLVTKDGEFVYTLDETEVPQLLNKEVMEYKIIRRLTLNKKQKMSKKLWTITDWLFGI